MTGFGSDKSTRMSFLIPPKTASAAFSTAFFLFFVLLLTSAFSAFASDRIFGSFSSDLPASARTAFFFDLRKLRALSFPSSADGAGESAVPELLLSLDKQLADQGIAPGFTSGAFFFAGGSAGLLLDSSLSPKQFADSSSPGNDRVLAVTEKRTPDGHSLFLFEDSRDGEKPDDALACAFHGQKPGRILVSTMSGLSLLLKEEKGLTPELRGALEHLPENTVLEGVLEPDFSGMPPESISPLWNGVGRIAFAFSWKEQDPSPFCGSVLFFPRTPDAAGTVRRNVLELVRSAYAAGREKGEIRPEMMFAFQVLPGSGFTELRIRLTGPDAEDFVKLFATELKNGVFGKCH